MERILINSMTREKRFAHQKDETIERLYIEQPGQQSLVGSIFLGTVERVVPGMNAAFVNIGEEKSGFLYRDKLPAFLLDERPKEEKANRSISSYLHQGEKLLVQVEKDAAGTKGPRLTGVIELSGRHLVYMPSGRFTAVSKKMADEEIRKKWREFGQEVKEESEGIMFRTSAMLETEETIENELNTLRDHYRSLQFQANKMKKPGLVEAKDFFYEELLTVIEQASSGEVLVDDLSLKKGLEPYCSEKELEVLYYNQTENIFSKYGIEKEIERTLKKIIWLNNGAYLIFDEAEALTIIDVNTGRFSGKNDLQETVVETNKLAAAEIARQIRIRDLAGMILIDFIDMKKEKDREEVLKVMKASLAEDGRRTRIAGFTELGILQLTRKKTKLSISETLTVACTVCDGTGKVLSPETVAFRLERELWEHRTTDHEAIFIEITKDVAKLFSGENDVHRTRIEEAMGVKIYFREVEYAKPDYRILQLGTKQEILKRAES